MSIITRSVARGRFSTIRVGRYDEPSTASVTHNDPSVAKCCRYASDWGYGSLWVGNSCAYRATDQKRLIAVADPVGPGTDRHIGRG